MVSFPWWLCGNISACNPGDAGNSASVLGWEGLLEEGMITHSSILAGKIPWSLMGYGPSGHKELNTTEVTDHEPMQKGGQGLQPWHNVSKSKRSKDDCLFQ